MDNVSRHTGAGVNLQLKAPIKERVEQVIRLDSSTSNKEIEYEAILAGVDLTQSVSSEKLLIRSDSQLVVGQVNGEYEMRDQHMARYVRLVKQRLGIFTTWKLEHIPRDSNERVDALAVVAASIPIKEIVFLLIYYQLVLSITNDRVSQIDEARPSWMTHIMHYLSSGELPDNKVETHKVQVQAARFSLVNRQLYKWSLDGSYLKCLTNQ